MGEQMPEQSYGIEDEQGITVDESQLAMRGRRATPIEKPLVRDNTRPYPGNNRTGGSRSQSRGKSAVEVSLPETTPRLIDNEDEETPC